MFIWKTSNKTKLMDVIRDLETHIQEIGPTAEEYNSLVEQLGKLYKMKEVVTSNRVSADALVSAGASILAVVLILNHERLGVVTSKAMSFVKIR